jgi:hypothetical protein
MECEVIYVMIYDEIERRRENEVLIHSNDLRHMNIILKNEMMIMQNGGLRIED